MVETFISIFSTHCPTWADAQALVTIMLTAMNGTLFKAKPNTCLSVFGFLIDEPPSLSSVTVPQAKGPPEAKRGKEGPSPGASETAKPC